MKKAANDEATTTMRATTLRQRAEEWLRLTDRDVRAMPNEYVRQLVYELQVTQVELQLQNEELQQAYTALAAARDRYQDLYDFAPVGYVTLTAEGRIVDTNLTAAQLLGTGRGQLVGAHLFQFLAPEAREAVRRHLHQLRTANIPCTCDVSLSRGDGTQVILQVHSVPSPTAQANHRHYKTILADITARKEAETAQQRLAQQLLEVEDNERRHLARELHDEVMQTLTVLKLNLGAVAQAFTTAPPQLDESIETVEDLVEQVRNLSLDLRPSMLDDLGLITALQWYCERQARRVAVPIHFTARPFSTRLSSTLESTCFRVVQEALTNVAKHAQATEVWVHLELHNGTVDLTVSDNGTGFDVANMAAATTRESGVGLRGMMERLRLIGGSLTIISTPGQGTEIRAQIPCREAPTRSTAIFPTSDRAGLVTEHKGAEE